MEILDVIYIKLYNKSRFSKLVLKLIHFQIMKTIIVGGGITGIATALFAKKLGLKNIYLFEKTNSIGGILKDIKINNEVSFLRNCQYFASNSLIFNVIDKKHFYEFKHSCGTFSRFNGDLITRNDFAGPTFNLNEGEISSDIDLNKDDINSYFQCYPEPVRSELNKLFSGYLIPALYIHHAYFRCNYKEYLFKIK